MILVFASAVAASFAGGALFGVWLYPHWMAWAVTDTRLARAFFLRFRTAPMIARLNESGPTCPTCGWVVHKNEEWRAL